jgi:predicted aldo/keto reductase-like oxidoreductase
MMVTRLGFGGIPIQRVTESEAVAVVKRCLELGINYIDTANGYTNSEERIGKALAGQREGLVIATKSSSRDPREVAAHIQQSRKSLGIDSIDLYQFHNVSDFDTYDKVIDPNGLMGVVMQAKEKGQVKHIGISSHQIDVAKAAVKSGHFETLMFPFNFVTCEAAEQLLPLTREHDVGLIAMKPLAGGMLDNIPIAVKYLLQFPEVALLVGIEKIPEIEEIVQVLAGSDRLSATELHEMPRLKDELRTTFCHRCDYCQPCSAGIRISTVLTFAPSLSRRAPERLFHGVYAESMQKVVDCIQCGECETRCPYHLPIRKMMAEFSAWYEAEKSKYLK